MLTAPYSAGCGYDFKIGKRYVVYAWKTAQLRLTTSICSRTRPLEEAAEDLQYLSAIPPTGNGARIFGRVKQHEPDPGEQITVDYGPMDGVTVAVRGPGFSRETRTNEHGRYEVLGVPPGKVTIEVLPPPEFNPRYLQREFEVRDPRACVQANFSVRWEARIIGSVVDSAGQPVAGITVEAIAAEHWCSGHDGSRPTSCPSRPRLCAVAAHGTRGHRTQHG